MKKLLCILFIVSTAFVFAQSPIPAGAKLDTVATGFQQAEGPVWKDGVGLLFSDIARSRIYNWNPATNAVTTYLYPSDSSNGITFDREGRLVLTQMQQRRVARQEADGSITVLASTFMGKKFSSPNDIVVKSDGAIFFTDPNFNIPRGQRQELSFMGIFRISPAGDVQLLDSTVKLPNGICFSSDEKLLYVNESQLGNLYVWDVVGDTAISGKRLLWHCPSGGYLDGMKIDADGNIYCTGPGGVWIISPSGTLLGRVLISSGCSNCAWGDADRKALYITSNNLIYRIRLTPSAIEGQGSVMPKDYELKANYPNPFNPSTVISYSLPEAATVTIDFITVGGEVLESRTMKQNAGIHSLTWSAPHLASGVYFCRFHTEGKSVVDKIQKLVLMK